MFEIVYNKPKPVKGTYALNGLTREEVETIIEAIFNYEYYGKLHKKLEKAWEGTIRDGSDPIF